MSLPFSSRPGRHERHLRRRLGNPLFPAATRGVSDPALKEAQRKDREELVAFMASLRDLVQQAVELGPSEESQRILDLKAELDRAYEEASGLSDDQAGNKEAIRQLTAVIMSSVRSAAGNDGLARQELDAEEEARRLHFQLLEYPLVADMLHPESPIGPDELVPTLLSESPDALAAVLGLFDAAQLLLLCRDARQLLAECGPLPGDLEAEARARLYQMEARLGDLVPGAVRQK